MKSKRRNQSGARDTYYTAYRKTDKPKAYDKARHADNPHVIATRSVSSHYPTSVIPLTTAEQEDIATVDLERNSLTDSTGVLHHVDHAWPLSRGGVHHPLNLQVLPHTENVSKGAKTDLKNPIVRQGLFCTVFGIERHKAHVVMSYGRR